MRVVFLYKSPANGPVVQRLSEAMSVPSSCLHESLVSEITDTSEVVVIRWDSCVEVPGTVALNDPGPVALSRDKIQSRRVFAELAPPTYTEAPVPLPCILRPRRHSGGRRFNVVEDYGTLLRLIRRYRLRGWYASPIIQKAEEFRVFVVCGRIACVSQHYPPEAVPEQIMWNVAAGGRMVNVRWDEWKAPVLSASILATERLGLDFAAIDIATDSEGRTYVFEANTAPGIGNRYTKEQVAKCLSYSAEKRVEKGTGDRWKHFIHPSIREDRR